MLIVKRSQSLVRRASSAFRDHIVKDLGLLWWPTVLFIGILPPLPVGDRDDDLPKSNAHLKASHPHPHHHRK